MDPLSQTLSLLRPSSYGFRGLDAGGDWALDYPASKGLRCYAIQSGRCWIDLQGRGDGILLSAGDVVLVSGTTAYRLRGENPGPALDAFQFFPSFPVGETAVLNGGGACMGVGGHFSFGGLHAEWLLGMLPVLVHVRDDRGRTLRASIDRLMEELREPRPGSALIAEHLAQALLIEALRQHLADHAAEKSGWLFALADRRLYAAIAAMHAEPARKWSLRDLAKVAAMSRSTFAARFKDRVGEPAMEYLTRWRMMVAADRLATGDATIATVAPTVGYQSDSAFGAAFRRIVGHPPRSFARLSRE